MSLPRNTTGDAHVARVNFKNALASLPERTHLTGLCLAAAILFGFLFLPTTSLASPQANKLPAVGTAKQESKDEILLRRAEKLFNNALLAKGNDRKRFLQNSYGVLEEAFKENPKLSPAGVMFAKLLIAAGDKNSGAEQLHRVTIEHPLDPEAFSILGNVALSEGRLSTCRLFYQEAENLMKTLDDQDSRKKNLQVQIAAGQCTLHQQMAARLKTFGKTQLADDHCSQAIDSIEKWKKLEPKSTKPHIQLAQIHLNKNDYQLAEEAYKQAVKLDTKLIDTDLWMGNFHVNQGQKEDAIKRIKKAVSNSPKDEKVRIMAAGLYLSLAMPKEAKTEIDAALKMKPDNRSIKFLDAQYHRFEKQWDKAIDILQDLNTTNPTDFETANLLSFTLTEKETKEDLLQAIAIATVSTQRFPDPTSSLGRRAFIALCWAYHRDKQTDRAQTILNQLLKVGIRSNEIHSDEAYYVARLLNEFNQPRLAIPLLQNILSRKTSFAKRKDSHELLAKLQNPNKTAQPKTETNK